MVISRGSYLRVDTSVDCGSSYYQRFRILDALFVVIYVSVPGFWFSLLYRRRFGLKPVQTATKDPGYFLWLRNKNEELKSLRFLYETYQPQVYYWEVVEIYRRIFLIGVLPLLRLAS